MFKKLAAAAVLAGALAFSAAAPAVLSAGSLADHPGTVVAGGTGNWPNPMSTTDKSTKKDKSTDTSTTETSDTTLTTYTGNWPNPA